MRRFTSQTLAAAAFGVLLAACGGANDEPNARQQEEAAAMQRAVGLASQANAAQVKIERAKVAARGNAP
jgi:hypothetical protein